MQNREWYQIFVLKLFVVFVILSQMPDKYAREVVELDRYTGKRETQATPNHLTAFTGLHMTCVIVIEARNVSPSTEVVHLFHLVLASGDCTVDDKRLGVFRPPRTPGCALTLLQTA